MLSWAVSSNGMFLFVVVTCQTLKTYHKNKAKNWCVIGFLFFDKIRNRTDYIFPLY